MIRLIQRRLIVPRGDTGTFSIPVLAGKDTGDASVFTIFNPLTHRKIFEKVMQLSDGVLTMDLSHGDTVNLPVGQFVWDIKFYTNPTIADGHIVDGEEVDSYYAAFTLPVCEIRETGDNLLFSDEAPQATLSPGQIDYITASINEVTSSKNAAAGSAAEADTSAQNAETSASAAAVSEQAAQDSQEAALASQQAAQTAAEQAIASAEAAAETAAQIEADLESKANIADLDDVAFSGDYNDLSNTPYIPNKTSDLTNDSNYAVDANYVHTDNNYTTEEKNKLSGIAAGAEVNVNADWNAVNGDAFILNKPTKVSDFDNDVGYLTEHQDISGKANSADLATVATSGSYNDLSNKPIPDAPQTDGAVLISQNGEWVANDQFIVNFTYAKKKVTIEEETAGDPVLDPPSGGEYAPSSDALEEEVDYTKAVCDQSYFDIVAAYNANRKIVGFFTDIDDSDHSVELKPYIEIAGSDMTRPNIMFTGLFYNTTPASSIYLVCAGPSLFDWSVLSSFLMKMDGPFDENNSPYWDAADARIKNVESPEDNGDAANKQYVDNAIPTQVSQLTNDAGYLTSFTETDPTVPAWAKASTKPNYTAAEVGAPTVQEMNTAISTAIGNVNSFDMAVVQALPTQNINTHTIYLVPKTGETNDVYDEYIYINNAWEMIGNTQIDLSNKADKADTILETTLSRGRKNNTTVGGASLAFGINTEASGYYSVALGLDTTASSQGAFAEGKNTVAHYIAHAEGENTQALGQWAHSQGVGTVAKGAASFAGGDYTIANGHASFVTGRYNAVDSYDNWPTWVTNTSYEVGDRVKRNLMVQNQPTDVGYHCTVANSDATFDNAHWELDGYHMNYVEIVGNGKEYEDPETHQTIRAGSNAYALEWNGTAHYMGNIYVGANADSTGGTKVLCEADFATDSDIQNIINGGAGA